MGCRNRQAAARDSPPERMKTRLVSMRIKVQRGRGYVPAYPNSFGRR